MEEARRKQIEEEEIYRAEVRTRLERGGSQVAATFAGRDSASQTFSPLEQLAGSYGALHMPTTTALVAGDLLKTETNAKRRETLRGVRSLSIGIMILGLGFAALMVGLFVWFTVTGFRMKEASDAAAAAKARAACIEAVQRRHEALMHSAPSTMPPPLESTDFCDRL